jgi:hypothetical protein
MHERRSGCLEDSQAAPPWGDHHREVIIRGLLGPSEGHRRGVVRGLTGRGGSSSGISHLSAACGLCTATTKFRFQIRGSFLQPPRARNVGSANRKGRFCRAKWPHRSRIYPTSITLSGEVGYTRLSGGAISVSRPGSAAPALRSLPLAAVVPFDGCGDGAAFAAVLRARPLLFLCLFGRPPMRSLSAS